MKVAVVGATGLVGTKMLEVLAERNFTVTELIPVASERSVGKEIEFKGKKYKVHSMQQAIDAKPQIALLLVATVLTIALWFVPFAEYLVYIPSAGIELGGDKKAIIKYEDAELLMEKINL